MKSKEVIAAIAVLGIGILTGFVFGVNKSNVMAQTSGIVVDGATLDVLYDAIFHRPADASGRNFHLGRNLRIVLNDFNNSEEMIYYGALFKAVKSYEESQRAPGSLSEAEKQSHLDLIDSALSNLVSWVSTLPDQDPCRATVGPEQARTAVQNAYQRLSAAGKTNAENGLLNASRRIGPPSGISVYQKCLLAPTPTPSSTLTPTPSPALTASPSPSSIYPTVTPTPTL